MVHTTQNQFERMVEFMEEHPEWARQEIADNMLWNELVNLLQKTMYVMWHNGKE